MQAGSTRSLERTPRKVRFAMLAIVLLAAFVAPVTSSAGKGDGSGTATEPWIALATVDGSAARVSSEVQLGSWIGFASGYPKNTRNPWISVICMQGGDLVYGEGGTPSDAFKLGGAVSTWLAVGGAATCRAELGDLYWRGGQQYYTYLAHITFEAAG